MIKVLGDRVLVALPPAPDNITTKDGLILVRDPDAAKTPTQGIVMALGEKSGTVEIAKVFHAVVDINCEWTFEKITNQEHLRLYKRALIEAIGAMRPAPFEVELGDCVLFSRGAGDQFSEDGVDYVVLYEAELLGICEPITKDEAVA